MKTNNTKAVAKLIPIIIFASIVVLVALYGFFFLGRTDNMIQGEADVTEVRISSKVPGRVAHFYVEEGDYVRKGDTLAILSTPDIDAKLAQAYAAAEGADAQSRKAIVGTRKEQIAGAYELWQQAIAGLDIAEKSYERVQRLFDKGVLTAQKRDEAEANLKASNAREKAAKAQYEMAVNGAQFEDKEAAKAMVNRAKGAIAEVKSYIAESFLLAPVDGRVSERFPNEGELVGTGAPIMNIAKTDEKWGSFNVCEDKLPRFKMDEIISVYVPALDRKVDMRIYQFKDLGTYAAWKSTKTLGQYDRKTFQVKAKFVNADDEKDIYAGMSLVIKN